MDGMMWFGTEQSMRWIPAPRSGAKMEPQDNSNGGVLLNGGGFQQGSWGSHKLYTFEWSDASAREAERVIQAYAHGVYGRGLIHFVDPLYYDMNVAPARLSAPYMTTGSEGSSLVYDNSPQEVINSGFQANDLPAYSAQYALSGATFGFRGFEDSTFIPIPAGYTLYLGAFYSASAGGGVFYNTVNSDGVTGGTSTKLTALANNAVNVIPDAVPGAPAGVRVWIGRNSSTASTVTFSGLIARLFKAGETVKTSGPWTMGEGNSGARFVGKPTHVAYNGVGGGQIGYAATLREVGSWQFG